MARKKKAGIVAVASEAEEVLYEDHDGVARVTINRPERHNSMSWGVVEGLRGAFDRAKHDSAVRVVVLAGAGEKSFCAGADLSGMVEGGGFLALHKARGELAGFFTDLWELGKPTIARVQGYALAGGFGLALACDLIVASERATFGVPEIGVGLWPYMVTVPMLRAMPAKKALELIMTGRRVSAEEAERIGFLSQVVPPGELDAAVEELATSLASRSPAVMKLGRDSFYKVLDAGTREALGYLHAMLTVTAMTEDAAEGTAAFSEKRPPTWRGR